jgi:hypothetical protein
MARNAHPSWGLRLRSGRVEEQYERGRQTTKYPPHSHAHTSSDDSFAPLAGNPFMLLGERLVLVVVVHGVQSLRMAKGLLLCVTAGLVQGGGPCLWPGHHEHRAGRLSHCLRRYGWWGGCEAMCETGCLSCIISRAQGRKKKDSRGMPGNQFTVSRGARLNGSALNG